jgi:hypothetical protein
LVAGLMVMFSMERQRVVVRFAPGNVEPKLGGPLLQRFNKKRSRAAGSANFGFGDSSYM